VWKLAQKLPAQFSIGRFQIDSVFYCPVHILLPQTNAKHTFSWYRQRRRTKDHIEEIDFQEPFLLSSAGQSQNCTGNLSVEYATSASLLQVNWRMFSWLWGSVDFDSKYKILRGEKVKTRIYIINLKFPPPIISDWRILRWRGWASKQTVLLERKNGQLSAVLLVDWFDFGRLSLLYGL